MADSRDLLARRAEPFVREALGDTRVVAINGARQVGKSTLARAIAHNGVKAGATVRGDDLACLRHLARHVGSGFVAGYVLYTGQQTLPFGDRLSAMPLSALWETQP